ncbi:MAG: polyprenyl synthetase family protein [Planctomycetaceae bacterium]|nr:MAG: polyprenyl synthetase family protein [Planctomycetaceae bacterium]
MPRVEEALQTELQSRYESVAPLLRHGAQLGGKRLRPALVLLSAAVIDPGRVSESHVRLGVVLEMVHTATLIHDDVLDEAELRRRSPTVHSIWGEHAAILLGDYLFSQAFRLAATLPSTVACRWIGEAARQVCEGELRQVLARDALDLDEATYVEMIRGKTAELCGVACRLGSHFAGGSPQQIAALQRYGEELGIAFQIADDYLDLWGDDQAMGKTLGSDLLQGKWTLPVLRTLQTASSIDRAALVAILSGPPERRAEEARPLMERGDAQAYTLRVAEVHRDRAKGSLSALPAGEARDSLDALADFAVARSY